MDDRLREKRRDALVSHPSRVAILLAVCQFVFVCRYGCEDSGRDFEV